MPIFIIACHKEIEETNFFLSISGTSLFSALSTITYIQKVNQINHHEIIMTYANNRNQILLEFYQDTFP